MRGRVHVASFTRGENATLLQKKGRMNEPNLYKTARARRSPKSAKTRKFKHACEKSLNAKQKQNMLLEKAQKTRRPAETSILHNTGKSRRR